MFLFFNLNAQELSFKYDIESLPLTKDNLNLEKNENDLDIGTVDFNFLENENKYEIVINYNNKSYKIINKVPAQEIIGNIRRGFYFSSKLNNINYKYIYFEFEKKITDIFNTNSTYHTDILKNNLHFNIINPFQNKVLWCLNNGKYELFDKMEIYATPHLVGELYYLDFVLNHNVDKILAIDLNFDYTRNYWWGLRQYKDNKSMTFLYNDYYIRGNNYLPYFVSKEKANELWNEYPKKIIQDTTDISFNIENAMNGYTKKEDTILSKGTIFINSTLEPAITYIDNNGTRRSMENNSINNGVATATSPTLMQEFTTRFNKHLKNTLQYRKDNELGITDNTILSRYAEKVRLEKVGFSVQDIFNGSGNKIFSVPLIIDKGNFAYWSTNINNVEIVSLSYMIKGEVFIANKNNINTFFAPNEKDTPGESFKRGASKAWSGFVNFINHIWTQYKIFVIIAAVLFSIVFIGLIVLVIVKPDLLKFLKYLK